MPAANAPTQKVHWELPADVHRALKVRAARDGKTIPAVAVDALRVALGLKRKET